MSRWANIDYSGKETDNYRHGKSVIQKDECKAKWPKKDIFGQCHCIAFKISNQVA